MVVNLPKKFNFRINTDFSNLPSQGGSLIFELTKAVGRRQEAEGKFLLELNFSDLGCPNQLVLCYGISD
jgi:hypothetical protein